MPARATAIVLGAGSGTRLAAGAPKALVPLGGIPLVRWSVETLASLAGIERIVLVVPPGAAGGDVAAAAGLRTGDVAVPGGARRRDSVLNGLRASGPAPHVLVHDAARPLAGAALFERVLAAAREHGAAVPALPLADALVREDAGFSAGEVERAGLRAVQTPQGFERALLGRAHAAAPAEWDALDDGAMVRRLGERVALVPGDPDNLKVTWPADVARAEAALRARGAGAVERRVGYGWDVHPLRAGRKFVLAGIVLDDEFGPHGHSDGDPLAHAVADALLGAAALGDIGQLFPDDDPRFAGLPGPELLARTVAVLREHGFRPLQVDAVLVLDRPKIAPRRDEVRAGLARALGLPLDSVSLKGKRTEGLGGLAGGAGVACHAVATVARP